MIYRNKIDTNFVRVRVGYCEDKICYWCKENLRKIFCDDIFLWQIENIINKFIVAK